MLNQILPFPPNRNSGTFDHKWNVSPLIIEKLFSAGMAYSMVCKKYDYRVIKYTFFFESFDNLSDMPVSNANRIEVSSPVSQKNRIIRVIRGQFNQIMRSWIKSELAYHSFFKYIIVLFRGSSYFTPV